MDAFNNHLAQNRTVNIDQALRLKHGREKTGLTQRDAAKHLNVALSTYRGWEQAGGAEPGSIAKMLEVCALFNISLDWWLSGKQCGPVLTDDEMRLITMAKHLKPEAIKAMLDLMELLGNKTRG